MPIMFMISRSRSPLLIAELFYYVLDFLAEPTSADNSCIQVQTPDPDSRAALAALARTCRRFKEPCLDYLWRKINSLSPLLRLCCSKDYVERMDEYSCHLRPLAPTDLDVMCRYLDRIRELEVQDTSSLLCLQSTYFETALLPNLCVLKWDQERNTTIKYIKPLLCPSLTVLDITAYGQDETSLSSLFKSCPLHCPDLTTIIVHSYNYYEEFQDSLSHALCSLKELRHLTLYVTIDDIAMQDIFMSQKYEELTLVTDVDQLAESSPQPSDTMIPLCNVRKLELWLAELDPITRFLRPADQKFTEVTIHLHNLELPPVIGSFFNGLACRTRTCPLESLRMDSKDLDSRKNVAGFALLFDTFQPLTFLGNLRELSIQLEHPISLIDEQLEELARGWPLLQTFDLSCIRPSPGKWITLQRLLLLAGVCLKLREVGLTLDAREIPTGLPLPVGPRFETISHMYFPNSPVDDTSAVGRFLLTYFPSLTSAGKWKEFRWRQEWMDDTSAERWWEVWGHVEDYRRRELDGDKTDSGDSRRRG